MEAIAIRLEATATSNKGIAALLLVGHIIHSFLPVRTRPSPAQMSSPQEQSQDEGLWDPLAGLGSRKKPMLNPANPRRSNHPN